MLGNDEVYRLIKPVNIEPVLKQIDRLYFEFVIGEASPGNHVDRFWIHRKEEKSPKELVEFLDSLNLEGTRFRYRVRKILAGQNIKPHKDKHAWMIGRNISRYHVPLITHPDVVMRWPNRDAQVHLKQGHLYEVCYSETHEVLNPSNIDRIHIQIDQIN